MRAGHPLSRGRDRMVVPHWSLLLLILAMALSACGVSRAAAASIEQDALPAASEPASASP
jgi:hypothetical protein